MAGRAWGSVVGAALLGALPGIAMAQGAADRDHVWIVDQDGDEVPVYGCWELKSITHPMSFGEVGTHLVFSAEPLENDFASEGVVEGADGNLWTRVAISFPDASFVLLERVDTDADPHTLYVVAIIAADGAYQRTYATTAAELAGEAPGSDLMVYERVGCGAVGR